MANRNSTLRVALYARVSTTNQSTDSQLLDLRRYVRERGFRRHALGPVGKSRARLGLTVTTAAASPVGF